MKALADVGCLEAIVATVWSAYQGGRGVVHDFAFRFVCTLAGFVALRVAAHSAGNIASLDLSAGSAALLVSSFLVGVVGVGGQLHYVILFGKVPR